MTTYGCGCGCLVRGLPASEMVLTRWVNGGKVRFAVVARDCVDVHLSGRESAEVNPGASIDGFGAEDDPAEMIEFGFQASDDLGDGREIMIRVKVWDDPGDSAAALETIAETHAYYRAARKLGIPVERVQIVSE